MTMDTVTLGGSGLEVSPIAFGTWQLSSAWGGFDERETTAAIHYAREQGSTSSTPRRPTGSASPSGRSAGCCATTSTTGATR